MASHYFVKLEHFEGPLDLLLYLIRENELNIFDINLLTLTGQYLDYLRLLKFKDLNDAAAFMEMAAVLIEIKSRYLLPTEERKSIEEDLGEEDQATSLQQRLLEFDRFRRAAEFLANNQQSAPLCRSNSEWQRLTPQFEDIEAPLRGDPSHLIVLYEQLLSTISDRRPARVTAQTERVSLEEVIEKMLSYIEQARFALFQRLYRDMKSRYDLVANTLSMLQLVRDGRLKLYQEELMGPIWIYRKDVLVEDIPIGKEVEMEEHPVLEAKDQLSMDQTSNQTVEA
jgi:segregation and condensation protein A